MPMGEPPKAFSSRSALRRRAASTWRISSSAAARIATSASVRSARPDSSIGAREMSAMSPMGLPLEPQSVTPR